jgi:hypothetical protein
MDERSSPEFVNIRILQTSFRFFFFRFKGTKSNCFYGQLGWSRLTRTNLQIILDVERFLKK